MEGFTCYHGQRQVFLRKVSLTGSPAKSKTGRKTTILRISVGLGALAVLCLMQDWGRLAEVLSGLGAGAPALSIVCVLAGNLVIIFRWWLLLRAQQAYVGYWAAVKIHFVGLFYNNILLSSVGGDMLRAWYVTKHTDRRFEAALSVLADRVIGLGTMILMAIGFYWLFPVDSAIEARRVAESGNNGSAGGFLAENWHYAAILAGGVFVVFLGLLVYPRTRRALVKGFKGIMAHRGRLLAAVVLYCRRPGVVFSAMGLTFLAQSMVITGFYYIGVSLGIEASIKYYFVFFPISWVVGALPISPGGIGVLELGLVGLFMLLPGVTSEHGMALALCQRAIFLLCSVPGIVIHVSGFHLPPAQEREEFFVDSGDSGD
jgi:uncharacterized membrane protein YbhN (UPF0104 family)